VIIRLPGLAPGSFFMPEAPGKIFFTPIYQVYPAKLRQFIRLSLISQPVGY